MAACIFWVFKLALLISPDFLIWSINVELIAPLNIKLTICTFNRWGFSFTPQANCIHDVYLAVSILQKTASNDRNTRSMNVLYVEVNYAELLNCHAWVTVPDSYTRLNLWNVIQRNPVCENYMFIFENVVELKRQFYTLETWENKRQFIRVKMLYIFVNRNHVNKYSNIEHFNKKSHFEHLKDTKRLDALNVSMH